MKRHDDAGVVLVTILVVMALCVAVIVTMTTDSENATRATGRNLDAAQARMLIAGGEASAVSALLKDMSNTDLADGPTEAWANIGQADIPIAGGRFRLVIDDANARFNVNTLIAGSVVARQNLSSVVAAAGLPSEVAVRIAASLQGGKALLDIQDLEVRAGLSPLEIATLAPFLTATPDLTGGVNINTAKEPVLRALLRNNDAANTLLTYRSEMQLITSASLLDLGLILPAGLTVSSNVFIVHIAVSIGDTNVTSEAVIHRWLNDAGPADAAVFQRRLGRQVIP